MKTKLIEHKKSKSSNWVKLDIRNRNSESKISTKNNFGYKKKPEWITVKLPTGKKYSNLRSITSLIPYLKNCHFVRIYLSL